MSHTQCYSISFESLKSIMFETIIIIVKRKKKGGAQIHLTTDLLNRNGTFMDFSIKSVPFIIIENVCISHFFVERVKQ